MSRPRRVGGGERNKASFRFAAAGFGPADTAAVSSDAKKLYFAPAIDVTASQKSCKCLYAASSSIRS